MDCAVPSCVEGSSREGEEGSVNVMLERVSVFTETSTV